MDASGMHVVKQLACCLVQMKAASICGVPWLMMVLSSATTALPDARARCTSGRTLRFKDADAACITLRQRRVTYTTYVRHTTCRIGQVHVSVLCTILFSMLEAGWFMHRCTSNARLC